MTTIKGQIIDIDEFNRLLTLKTRQRIQRVTMQRSAFNRFFKYLVPGNWLIGTVKTRTLPNSHLNKTTITDITHIIRPTRRKRIVLFSRMRIQDQTRDFLMSMKVKLFLDLEMSMHPYTVDKQFRQEIIQAGYVLVDEQDKIISKYTAFIKPTLYKTLTKRTLKFLDLSQEDVDNGIDYKTFHTHLTHLIKKYDPAIMIWGKNDNIALKDCAQINNLPNLPAKTRFVNLLMLHKNFFGLKDDLGLANAYKLYGNTLDTQRHDALEDAVMTMKIYQGFKALIHGKIQVDSTVLKR